MKKMSRLIYLLPLLKRADKSAMKRGEKRIKYDDRNEQTGFVTGVYTMKKAKHTTLAGQGAWLGKPEGLAAHSSIITIPTYTQSVNGPQSPCLRKGGEGDAKSSAVA